MKLKRISILICLLITTLNCFANTSFRSIRFNNKQSPSILINMEEEMKLSFRNDSLVLTTLDYEISFGKDKVDSWEFSEDWSNLILPEPNFEIIGNGSADSPFNTIAVLSMTEPIGGEVWVTGYIVGSFIGSEIDTGTNISKIDHNPNNLLLSPARNVRDLSKFIGIDISECDSLRDSLNLYDHPELRKREITIKGKIDKFGGRTGIINAMDYEWGPKGKASSKVSTIIPEGNILNIGNAIKINNFNTEAETNIYDLNGRLIKSYQNLTNATISLDCIPDGIYLIQIGSQTIKIHVRR